MTPSGAPRIHCSYFQRDHAISRKAGQKTFRGGMMKKSLVCQLLILLLGVWASSCYSAMFGPPHRVEHVCLQFFNQNIDHSYKYHLVLTPLSGGYYSVAGSHCHESAANGTAQEMPLHGSAAMIGDKLEVSMDIMDVSDWVMTPETEGLNVLEFHLTLDPQSYEGTYESVATVYHAAGETWSPKSNVDIGTVGRISCAYRCGASAQ